MPEPTLHRQVERVVYHMMSAADLALIETLADRYWDSAVAKASEVESKGDAILRAIHGHERGLPFFAALRFVRIVDGTAHLEVEFWSDVAPQEAPPAAAVAAPPREETPPEQPRVEWKVPPVEMPLCASVSEWGRACVLTKHPETVQHSDGWKSWWSTDTVQKMQEHAAGRGPDPFANKADDTPAVTRALAEEEAYRRAHPEHAPIASVAVAKGETPAATTSDAVVSYIPPVPGGPPEGAPAAPAVPEDKPSYAPRSPSDPYDKKLEFRTGPMVGKWMSQLTSAELVYLRTKFHQALVAAKKDQDEARAEKYGKWLRLTERWATFREVTLEPVQSEPGGKG